MRNTKTIGIQTKPFPSYLTSRISHQFRICPKIWKRAGRHRSGTKRDFPTVFNPSYGWRWSKAARTNARKYARCAALMQWWMLVSVNFLAGQCAGRSHNSNICLSFLKKQYMFVALDGMDGQDSSSLTSTNPARSWWALSWGCCQ